MRRDEGFVGGGVHEAADFGGIGEPDFDKPAVAVRIGIDFFWSVVQGAVGFDDFAGSGSVNVADGFYGLDRAERFAGSRFSRRL